MIYRPNKETGVRNCGRRFLYSNLVERWKTEIGYGDLIIRNNGLLAKRDIFRLQCPYDLPMQHNTAAIIRDIIIK